MSPPWLLRSLAQGTPDRCLHMSLDASRHLPASAQAMSAPPQQVSRPDLAASDCLAFPDHSLADREARQSFVQQLKHTDALQPWGKLTLTWYGHLHAQANNATGMTLAAAKPAWTFIM